MSLNSQYLQEMVKAGLSPAKPVQILDDGEIHRYRIEGDSRGSLNGWYVCYDRSVLVCGSWKTGHKIVVCDQSLSRLSAEQRKLRQRQVAEAQEKAQIEKRKQHELVAEKVAREWEQASPALQTHPYLLKKLVRPFGIRQLGDTLLIPLRDINGKLWSLQYITPNGQKYFAKGGRIEGCFHLLGQVGEALYFSEGYSTAATLHQFTGTTMVIAFNAGNLKKAAREIKKKYPDVKLVFAADNDRTSRVNTGLLKAREAAKEVKGSVIWPNFPEGVEGTDFNDLIVNGGCLNE
ncbi:toprim domain-containing protein [Endozoicomonas arenosclerae]|uniref:toprim domain-containing protein n=1 Tax=Endozoicomonas arenosclerae TaxID=1633495 RepID=UPI0007826C5E|nr:toprim domain-containing protein [Endozoicomonas arenosclerae]